MGKTTKTKVSSSHRNIIEYITPNDSSLMIQVYANLSIESDYLGSHILSTWIQGEEFRITKKIVYEALLYL